MTALSPGPRLPQYATLCAPEEVVFEKDFCLRFAPSLVAGQRRWKANPAPRRDLLTAQHFSDQPMLDKRTESGCQLRRWLVADGLGAYLASTSRCHLGIEGLAYSQSEGCRLVLSRDSTLIDTVVGVLASLSRAFQSGSNPLGDVERIAAGASGAERSRSPCGEEACSSSHAEGGLVARRRKAKPRGRLIPITGTEYSIPPDYDPSKLYFDFPCSPAGPFLSPFERIAASTAKLRPRQMRECDRPLPCNLRFFIPRLPVAIRR